MVVWGLLGWLVVALWAMGASHPSGLMVELERSAYYNALLQKLFRLPPMMLKRVYLSKRGGRYVAVIKAVDRASAYYWADRYAAYGFRPHVIEFGGMERRTLTKPRQHRRLKRLRYRDGNVTVVVLVRPAWSASASTEQDHIEIGLRYVEPVKQVHQEPFFLLPPVEEVSNELPKEALRRWLGQVRTDYTKGKEASAPALQGLHLFGRYQAPIDQGTQRSTAPINRAEIKLQWDLLKGGYAGTQSQRKRASLDWDVTYLKLCQTLDRYLSSRRIERMQAAMNQYQIDRLRQYAYQLAEVLRGAQRRLVAGEATMEMIDRMREKIEMTRLRLSHLERLPHDQPRQPLIHLIEHIEMLKLRPLNALQVLAIQKSFPIRIEEKIAQRSDIQTAWWREVKLGLFASKTMDTASRDYQKIGLYADIPLWYDAQERERRRIRAKWHQLKKHLIEEEVAAEVARLYRNIENLRLEITVAKKRLVYLTRRQKRLRALAQAGQKRYEGRSIERAALALALNRLTLQERIDTLRLEMTSALLQLGQSVQAERFETILKD